MVEVERLHGGVGWGEVGGAVPSGRLGLMGWDVDRRMLSRRIQKTDIGGDSHWQLLPPCCGRGAACPHLQSLDEAQYPDGRHCELSDIVGIPADFRNVLGAWIEDPTARLKCQQEFRTLLSLDLPTSAASAWRDRVTSKLSALNVESANISPLWQRSICFCEGRLCCCY